MTCFFVVRLKFQEIVFKIKWNCVNICINSNKSTSHFIINGEIAFYKVEQFCTKM